MLGRSTRTLCSIDEFEERHTFEESDNVLSEIDNLTYEMPSFAETLEEESGDDSKQSIEESPFFNRTWRSWGTVDNGNIMFDNRPGVAPRIYTPSKRRIYGQK